MWGTMRFIFYFLFAAISITFAAQSRAAPTLFEQHACVACHSLDGSPLRGPTLRGLAGSSRAVLRDGVKSTITADADYIARSIREPDADTVDGYPAGLMPKFPLDEAAISALVGAIEALPSGPLPPPKSIALLAISAAAFVGLHLVLASLPVRRKLVAGLGERGYAGLFSVLALASFLGMMQGFRSAPFVQLWVAPPQLRWLPNLVLPVAWLLLVCSMSTKSPTLATVPGAPPVSEAVGIIRVTRHPMLWSFALWGLAHIPPNGDLRSLLLFSAIVVLSIAGMFHIDSRRAALFPEPWAPIARTTSVLPFAAIVAGRNSLVLREIGWIRLLVAVACWAMALLGHKFLIGLSPLP